MAEQPLAGVWERWATPGLKVQYHPEENDEGEIEMVPVEYDFSAENLAQFVRNFERTFSERRLVMDDGNHRAADPDHTQPQELARYSGEAAIWDGKVIAFWDQFPDLPPPDPAALLAALREKFPRASSADGLWGYRREVTPLGEQLLPNMSQTSPQFSKEDTDEAGQPIGYNVSAVSPVFVAHQNGTVLMSKRARFSAGPPPSEEDDPDLDEDGEVDVEHYPLPDALLKAAGIESDEDWDQAGGSATMGKVARLDKGNYDPGEKRADDGKWTSGGGGGAAPKAKKAAPQWQKAETKPVPKGEGGKPGGGAGAQLHPDVVKRLKELGISKLPAAHIGDVKVSAALHSDNPHEGALLQWKDDQGRPQRAYSAQFDAKNAAQKFARVLENRPKVDAQMDNLRADAAENPGAAAALTIALTGLRPGGKDSLKSTGHYGATTMEARHVSFDDEGAHIQYVGKAGKVNKATVTDPAAVAALKKNVEGKAPTDRVFNVPPDKVAGALPKGVKVKDLRTLTATTDAERHLAGITPKLTGNDKQDARQIVGILKQVSTLVSKQLNNTPAMARRSYIAPQVIQAWGKQHGIKPEWLGAEPAAPGKMSKTTMAQPSSGVHAPRPLGEERTMADKPDDKKEAPAAVGLSPEMRKMACAKFGMPDGATDGELLAHILGRMGDDKDGDATFDVDPSNKEQNAAIHLKTGNVHDDVNSSKTGKFSDLPRDAKPGMQDEVKPNSAANFAKAVPEIVAALGKRTEAAEKVAAAAQARLDALEKERAEAEFATFARQMVDEEGRWPEGDHAGCVTFAKKLGISEAKKHIEQHMPPRAAFKRQTQGGHPIGKTPTASKMDRAATFSKRTQEICKEIEGSFVNKNQAFAEAQRRARAEMPENYEGME